MNSNPDLSSSDFSDHEIRLLTLEVVYAFAGEYDVPDLQQSVADTFCSMYTLFDPYELEALGITLSYGEGDGH